MSTQENADSQLARAEAQSENEKYQNSESVFPVDGLDGISIPGGLDGRT
jgi:hypothetical protein